MKRLALLLIIFAASPASEVRAAADDVVRLAPAEQSYQRYVSAYYLDKPAAEHQVFRFAINSLSRRRRIGQPATVNDTLLRIDLRDYGISAAAWESLIVDKRGYRLEPFFSAEVAGDGEYQLRLATKSAGAVVRIDWFIARAFVEPGYSAFLGLPNNLAQLQKDFYVQADGVEKLGLREGGAVLSSIVALHNRQLERWPTITGAFWLSRDAGSSVGKQNVLDNVFEIQHDAGEFIWSLPNGLQAYYLANAAGAQQQEVPANLAIDSRTSLQDKRVRNAYSCVTCHADGINAFDNVVAKLIRSGATYASYEKAQQLAIEEYHLSPLAQQIERDNERFAAAVMLCNGLEPKANAIAFESVLKRYVDGRVNLEIAAREIGVEPDKLRAKLPQLYSGTANALLAQESIARDAWESISYRAALLCRGAK